MASTRLRVNTSSQIFHRVAEADDLPQTDVGTSDANAQGIGGTGEVEIASGSNVTYGTAHQVVDSTEAAIGGDVAITKFISIKNTGFTSSDKDTAVADGATLTVGVGGAFASGGFTLMAGEQITLHGLGGGSNNLSEFQIDSSVAATYVEIVYL
jgi:hypothetical protein